MELTQIYKKTEDEWGEDSVISEFIEKDTPIPSGWTDDVYTLIPYEPPIPTIEEQLLDIQLAMIELSKGE